MNDHVTYCKIAIYSETTTLQKIDRCFQRKRIIGLWITVSYKMISQKLLKTNIRTLALVMPVKKVFMAKKFIELFADWQEKKNWHYYSSKENWSWNPDFRVMDAYSILLDIGGKTPETNLDVSENSEQLRRYRKHFQILSSPIFMNSVGTAKGSWQNTNCLFLS